MKNLSTVLAKIFNTLGNKYLSDNFGTEPFEFKVKIRRGDRDDDLQDYIIEVYTTPDIPRNFDYKDGPRDYVHGIDISVLGGKFREFLKYIDPTFGEFRKTVGIRFMNIAK